MRKIDLTGQTFGRLTVIAPAPNGKQWKSRWLCRCTCGNETVVHYSSLKNGSSTSCGCWRSEYLRDKHLEHGMARTPVYNVWSKMRQRCEKPYDHAYSRYGGRGITVCDRWQSFENFYSDMGEPPTPEHQLDRIDNNGHYSPDNCQWSTPKEQAQNRSNSVNLTWNGKTQSIALWAEEMGMKYATLYQRIVHANWPIEKAITTPTRPMKR